MRPRIVGALAERVGIAIDRRERLIRGHIGLGVGAIVGLGDHSPGEIRSGLGDKEREPGLSDRAYSAAMSGEIGEFVAA